MLRNVAIGTKAIIVVAAPCALTATLMLTLYRQGRTIADAQGWSQHSRSVLDEIERVEFGLVDIQGQSLQLALLGETGQPVEAATTRQVEVAEALTELATLTIDNPAQNERIAKLVPVAKSLLGDLDVVLTALRLGAEDVDTRVAANDRVLDSILWAIREVKRTELDVGSQRLARVATLGQERQATVILGGVATLAFALLVGAFLTRSVIWRLHVVRENVARLSTDQDLLPPVSGRDEIGQIDRAFHGLVRTLRSQQSDNDMFVYSVSHDLRSPLVNLQGFSKELKMALGRLHELLTHPDVPEKVRAAAFEIADREMAEALHFIDIAVQRQAGIIDSLLRLSRAGRVEYRLQVVDVAACVGTLVAALQRRHTADDVEFSVGELAPAWGDPDAIERIFDNLISNAIKYRRPDCTARIEVGSSTESPFAVRYFVKDNGIGIAADQLERVFTPFTRLSGGKGEGIGLALVRRAVERHGGRVWIEATVGEGSTVSFTLRTP